MEGVSSGLAGCAGCADGSLGWGQAARLPLLGSLRSSPPRAEPPVSPSLPRCPYLRGAGAALGEPERLQLSGRFRRSHDFSQAPRKLPGKPEITDNADEKKCGRVRDTSLRVSS